jgi:hypothetical protein
MPASYEEIEAFLKTEVSSLTNKPDITADSVLVGPGRVMDSADLVMLLLSAEDYARDTLDAHFDWSSDSAMSAARSVLRSVGSLARHLEQLKAA